MTAPENTSGTGTQMPEGTFLPVALKYCGGCNPNYERGHIVRDLRKDLPMLSFEPWQPEKQYCYALVICGCYQQCLHFSCDNAEKGILWVHQKEDYPNVHEHLAVYAASAGKAEE